MEDTNINTNASEIIEKIEDVIKGTTPEQVATVDTKESEKTLDVTNVEDLKTKVSDVEVFGDGDTFKLLCKASSKSQGWMKSTKVCNVVGGCLVQVSTQQKNPDGSYAVAEALTFIANNHLRDGKIGPM